MGKGATSRRYSEEFKRDAVAMWRTQVSTASKAAWSTRWTFMATGYQPRAFAWSRKLRPLSKSAHEDGERR